jgi:hypothetical protein
VHVEELGKLKTIIHHNGQVGRYGECNRGFGKSVGECCFPIHGIYIYKYCEYAVICSVYSRDENIYERLMVLYLGAGCILKRCVL